MININRKVLAQQANEIGASDLVFGITLIREILDNNMVTFRILVQNIMSNFTLVDARRLSLTEAWKCYKTHCKVWGG
jgi:hypothetical protein